MPAAEKKKKNGEKKKLAIAKILQSKKDIGESSNDNIDREKTTLDSWRVV